MAVSTRSVGAALVALVGRDRVIDDPAALTTAAVDGRAPRWIVRPVTIEHVSVVLRLATEERLAVIPRGSGSALDLGAPPARIDIALDLRGLGRILEYNPADLTASVQAGVTLGGLRRELAGRRQMLPLDPPEGAWRTLGGITATNASGPLRCRYGTMRDFLLGVRFVLPDGVVTWGGARVVKSVTGYDVPKLMIGALGTLGVLAELTIRLHPLPDVERSWLATFGSVEHAQGFIARVLDSTVQPQRLEVVNGQILDATEESPGVAGVAIGVGSVEAAVIAQETSLRKMATAAGGAFHAVAESWWERYGRLIGASPLVLRVATLPSHLSATVQEIERIFKDAGETEPAIGGCAAIGSLVVLAEVSSAESLRTRLDALRQFLGGFGGHAILARAPHDVRAALDPWGPIEPSALALTRGLKNEFDPLGILNPGRFVGGL